MATTVRAADEADAEAIAAVGVDSWREGFRGLVPEHVSAEQAWSVEEVKRRLSTRDRERRHVLVGETDGRVGGFVVIGPSRDPGATASVGEVMALFVDPSVWRRGVGRSLVDASLAILAGDGFDAVTVELPLTYFVPVRLARLGEGLVDVGHVDRVAEAGESQGDLTTQAASGTGDQSSTLGHASTPTRVDVARVAPWARSRSSDHR